MPQKHHEDRARAADIAAVNPWANREQGQATVLMLTIMALALFGMLGFAIDISRVYMQYQLAQAAADAAAQASASSIYSGTNTGSNAFGSSTVTCTSGSAITPCKYASLNGFSASNGDTVKVDFPTSVSGVTLSSSYSPSVVRLTIVRPVATTLMKMLGVSSLNVAAQGTAGIFSPPNAPVLVLDSDDKDAFKVTGTATLQVCGGGSIAVQVDSCNGNSGCAFGGPEAWNIANGAEVDISKAGSADNGTCGTGTGAEFAADGPGNVGGTSQIEKGTTGSYVANVTPAADPYASITEPTTSGLTSNPATCAVKIMAPYNACQAGLTYGCTVNCTLYYPGVYTNGINTGSSAVFAPGIYYLSKNGFQVGGGGTTVLNATGMTADPVTGQGVLFFLTGKGVVNIGGGSGNTVLNGTPTSSAYKGILFFGDRTQTNPGKLSHTINGGPGITLNGITYLVLTNSNNTNLNTLMIQANGNDTATVGQIVVDELVVGGPGTVQVLGGAAGSGNGVIAALVK